MPGRAIGIDLGGTKLAAGVVDESGHIDSLTEMPRPSTAAEIAQLPVAVADELIDESVLAVGLGVAGLVDYETGDLAWGPHVDGIEADFGSILRGAFGLPVAVDNDANVAGFAEARLGAGRGHSHVLMVTLGTGIGGGLIVDGAIQRGRGYAGEIGHFPIVADGEPCDCGQFGCWETLASGQRLDALASSAALADPDGIIAKAAGGDVPSGGHLFLAASSGDQDAQAMLEDVGRWLGVGLAGLVCVLDPDIIVVGGGVIQAEKLFLETARRTMEHRVSGGAHREPTPLVPAEFGRLAGVVGAGLLALEEVH